MELKTHFIQDDMLYDGSQLSSHFAYKKLHICGDSIVGFHGPCNIPEENMADLEDVIENDEIYSNNMLHFIGEFFFNSLYEVILYQRIFASIIKDELKKRTQSIIIRDGDDLFVKDRKLSISIATSTGLSNMFHFAMNTDTKNTPVDTVSLHELGIDDIYSFALDIMKLFKKEIANAEFARCKVRMK